MINLKKLIYTLTLILINARVALLLIISVTLATILHSGYTLYIEKKGEEKKHSILTTLGYNFIHALDKNSLLNPFNDPEKLLVQDKARNSESLEINSGFKFFRDTSADFDAPFLIANYHDPEKRIGVTVIWDLQSQKLVHKQEWNTSELWKTMAAKNGDQKSRFEILEKNHGTLRFKPTHSNIDAEGNLYSFRFTPLLRADQCGKVNIVGDFNLNLHHSSEFDRDGYLWTSNRGNAKQNPYGLRIQRDEIIQLDVTNGEVIFQKSIFDILRENNLEKILLAVDDFTKEESPLHSNDVQPVMTDGKFWKKGDVFISLRGRSLILLYRPSTNKVIKHIHAKTLLQHDIDIFSDNTIMVFDNNVTVKKGKLAVDGLNKLFLYNFETDNISYHLSDQIKEHNVKTTTRGLADYKINWGTMIEETNFGRILIFDNNGRKHSEYLIRDNSGKHTAFGWARLVDRDLGLSFLESVKHAECD